MDRYGSISLISAENGPTETKMAVNFGMKILIVDKYHSMRHIIRNLLVQLRFHNIDEAPNGMIALHMLSREKFDLVIADWYMEPTNGLELLKAIRADGNLKNIPFIMVTAESNPEKVVEAKEAGVSNYIVKPFNLPTLKAKLSSVLGEF